MVEPSGNVTVTVVPGSAAPLAVMVPFGLAVVVRVGASGAAVSAKFDVVVEDALPAASVALAVTGPEPCGVGDVAV